MVIVKLAGGLGNQLFQYAAGRRLAMRHNSLLALDLAYYAEQSLRSYRLGHFNIDARVATPVEVARFTERPAGRLRRWLLAVREAWSPYHQRAIIQERRPLQFDRAWVKVPGDAYLVGYWQNEQYFADISDRIRAEFTLRQPLSPTSTELLHQIKATLSVGVHVRRGDYATEARTAKLHGVCSPEYYQICARRILELHPGAVFFVFSDDPAWASDNLQLGATTIVVDKNGPERDYEDLHLLSQCRHFILANSTFSWWSVWLSPRPNKTVFAPKRWFAINQYDPSDLIPLSWHQV